MTMLFSPYSLGPLELSNRITIAPMCQYSAVDGLATDWHMIRKDQFAADDAAPMSFADQFYGLAGQVRPV